MDLVLESNNLLSAGRKLKSTPLPKMHDFFVVLMQLAESISVTVMFPFINQFVISTGITGGDEKKTGYYAGMLESVFFFSQSMTVVLWARASDRYGQRQIALLGPLGLAIVTTMFGLSTKFWMLLLFRGLMGVFNGNHGVSNTPKSAKLSESTNAAKVFSLASIMGQVGLTIGSSLGGVLSNPADHWPGTVLARSSLLQAHPYLLPCAATGCISLGISIVTLFGPGEAHSEGDSDAVESPSQSTFSSYKTLATDSIASKDLDNNIPHYGSITRLITRAHSTSEDTLVDIDAQALLQNAKTELMSYVSLKSLLTPDVLRPLSTLTLSTFLETSISVLIPITFISSIASGGLGMSAMQVGTLNSIGGIAGLVFNGACAPLLIRFFGAWKMHFVGMFAPIVGFSCIIMASLAARTAGYADGLTWTFVVIQYVSFMILPLGLTTAKMFAENGAPSEDVLGTNKVVVQIAQKLAKTVAPICVMSLFSISKEHDILCGQLVYVVCLATVAVGLRNILSLPRELSRL